jgi:hypothetical protein
MWSPSQTNPERRLHRGRASAPPGRASAALGVAAWLVTAGGACTDVHVEQTQVTWEAEASCQSADGGVGGQLQSPPSNSGNGNAVMDTYVVEIFELLSPTTSTADDCKACLASRHNCFREAASCVCGGQMPVSTDGLRQMLSGVQIGLPSKSPSLYCLRVMAVQRTADSENCECDPAWEKADRVRLCALSRPYAATPVPPIEMKLQCDASNAEYLACVGN